MATAQQEDTANRKFGVNERVLVRLREVPMLEIIDFRIGKLVQATVSKVMHPYYEIKVEHLQEHMLWRSLLHPDTFSLLGPKSRVKEGFVIARIDALTKEPLVCNESGL